MPQERLPVRKIKEVLRLHALGLSQRQIAPSCAVGQATVSDYLKAAEAAGLKWSDVADWDDDRLMQAVAPSPENTGPAKPVTRTGLRRSSATSCKPISTSPCNCSGRSTANQHPDGYRYSRFCDLYRQLACSGRKWCCDRSTGPARSCLSTMPATRSHPQPASAARCGKRPSSSRCWAPVITPTPRRV